MIIHFKSWNILWPKCTVNHLNKIERLFSAASALSLSRSLVLSFSFWILYDCLCDCCVWWAHRSSLLVLLFIIIHLWFRLLFILSSCFRSLVRFFFGECVSNSFICLRFDCRMWARTRTRSRTPNTPLIGHTVYNARTLARFFLHTVSKESILFSINLSAIHVTVFVYVYQPICWKRLIF